MIYPDRGFSSGPFFASPGGLCGGSILPGAILPGWASLPDLCIDNRIMIVFPACRGDPAGLLLACPFSWAAGVRGCSALFGLAVASLGRCRGVLCPGAVLYAVMRSGASVGLVVRVVGCPALPGVVLHVSMVLICLLDALRGVCRAFRAFMLYLFGVRV